jgi:hypothetical protein
MTNLADILARQRAAFLRDGYAKASPASSDLRRFPRSAPGAGEA